MSIELKRADNGYFYIHWSDGRRSKRISTREKDMGPARAFFSTWLSLNDKAPKRRVTCGGLWEIYIRDHVAKECASTETHKFAWKALAPRFAHLAPIEVTQTVIDAHLKARAPYSCFVELRLLAACWNYGAKKRHIAPADIPGPHDLVLPKPPGVRGRWLREAEMARLFESAKALRNGPRLSRIERFIWLAVETCARRQALLELTWAQVDFETRVVHLNPEGREQTSKRRASVPISDALLPVLQRAYEERKTDFVLDSPSRLHSALDRVAAHAKVEGVTAHVFRHSGATHMARHGVPLWKIAKILGNSVEQVERVYAKHSPDDLRDSVNLISGSRGTDLGAPK